MGCVPAELAMRGNNGGCSQELQRAAALYTPLLDEMLQQLNSESGGTVFIGANTQQMNTDFITNPQAFGIHACFPILWNCFKHFLAVIHMYPLGCIYWYSCRKHTKARAFLKHLCFQNVLKLV